MGWSTSSVFSLASSLVARLTSFIIILLMISAIASILVNATGPKAADPLSYTTGTDADRRVRPRHRFDGTSGDPNGAGRQGRGTEFARPRDWRVCAENGLIDHVPLIDSPARGPTKCSLLEKEYTCVLLKRSFAASDPWVHSRRVSFDNLTLSYLTSPRLGQKTFSPLGGCPRGTAWHHAGALL